MKISKESATVPDNSRDVSSQKCIRWVLLAVGAALLVCAVFLGITTNFHLGLLIQAVLSLGLLALGLWYPRIPHWAKIALLVVGVIMAAFAAFLYFYGNHDTVRYDEDVMFVLGAGIRGERVTSLLARRLDQAVIFHQKNPDALIVVCGGQGPQEAIAESLAMERYLIAAGVSPDVIVQEDQSTTTFENLSFARSLVEDRLGSRFTGALVTNDFHVYRATRIARNAGIEANHVGAYTKWYTLPSNYLREMLAVLRLWVLPEG
jgi:uncharacterized SAM-binding protein YcdF (DUF218 family)